MAYENSIIMTLMRALESNAAPRHLDGDEPRLHAKYPSDLSEDRRHPNEPQTTPRVGLVRFTRTLSRLLGIRA